MAAPRTPAFRGRARERKVLDDLLGRIRDGESAVLVIRGEAGIGKTALMRYCARQASGCRLVQIYSVQSEMELPLSALHQLCTPMLSCLSALPEPQQRTLRVAFGLAAGPAPDRFVLGLAVLSLLAENAAERPLICLVDDAQWLDEASSQVLGFVGRRLLAEPVGLLIGVREAAGERQFHLGFHADDLHQTTARRLACAVAHQLGLADPRLTPDDQHRALAATNTVQQVSKNLALPSTPPESRRPEFGHAVTIGP